MELDGSQFSGTLLWWLGFVYGAALLYALRAAPWRRLTQPGQLHALLGATVALIVLWHLRGEIQAGLSFHLLGVTTVTLMFGWSFALIAASVALLAVSLSAGYGLDGFVPSILTVGLLPITLSQISLVVVRSLLPKHFFIYVIGNGFLTAWLVSYVSGYLAVGLLVWNGYSLGDLEVTIMPFFPLMFFPEAVINGWITTIMVLFFPAWVHSFSDELYLRGK